MTNEDTPTPLPESELSTGMLYARLTDGYMIQHGVDLRTASVMAKAIRPVSAFWLEGSRPPGLQMPLSRYIKDNGVKIQTKSRY